MGDESEFERYEFFEKSQIQLYEFKESIRTWGCFVWYKNRRESELEWTSGHAQESARVLYGFRQDRLLHEYTSLTWDERSPAKLKSDWIRAVRAKRVQNLCQWLVDGTSMPNVLARVWAEDGGFVWALTGAYMWDLVNRADCRGGGFHTAPYERHACGLYGTASAKELARYASWRLSVSGCKFLLGLIRVWGKVIVGETGARVEYASPLLFVGEDFVLNELKPKWSEIPQLPLSKALEAMYRGISVWEALE